MLIQIIERPLWTGHVNLYRLDSDGCRELLDERDNLITDVFLQAFLNRLAGTAGTRDTLAVGWQAVGSGIAVPDAADTKLQAEAFRRAKDDAAISGGSIFITTTMSSLDANVPQARITTNFDPASNGGVGNGTPSTTSWTVAPDLAGFSPFDQAYISAYFKRYRVGDRVRFGLGAGNTTYEYREITGVEYNAGVTNCILTVTNPLSVVPPYRATVDGTINEVGVLADFPAVINVTANAGSLTAVAVDDIRYIGAGDFIRHTRPGYYNASGAVIDLHQYAVVTSTTPGSGNTGTINLVSPGWVPDFPVPKSGNPQSVASILPLTSDLVYGGRLYNFVSDLSFVKTRQFTLQIETIFNTIR